MIRFNKMMRFAEAGRHDKMTQFAEMGRHDKELTGI